MSYEISKNITVRHTEDNWKFSFSSDEYGTVTVHLDECIETITEIPIPKDCIQHFIDALRSFQ